MLLIVPFKDQWGDNLWQSSFQLWLLFVIFFHKQSLAFRKVWQSTISVRFLTRLYYNFNKSFNDEKIGLVFKTFSFFYFKFCHEYISLHCFLSNKKNLKTKIIGPIWHFSFDFLKMQKLKHPIPFKIEACSLM